MERFLFVVSLLQHPFLLPLSLVFSLFVSVFVSLGACSCLTCDVWAGDYDWT